MINRRNLLAEELLKILVARQLRRHVRLRTQPIIKSCYRRVKPSRPPIERCTTQLGHNHNLPSIFGDGIFAQASTHLYTSQIKNETHLVAARLRDLQSPVNLGKYGHVTHQFSTRAVSGKSSSDFHYSLRRSYSTLALVPVNSTVIIFIFT